MIALSNVQSADWIVYAIFGYFNEDWKTPPSTYLRKQLDVTGRGSKLFRCCDRISPHPASSG